MLGVASAVIGFCGALTGVSACTSEASSDGFAPFAYCGTTFDYQGGATGAAVLEDGGTDLYSNDGDKRLSDCKHTQELLATGVYDAEESLQRATAALVDAQVGAMLAAANVFGLSANLI